MKSERNRFKSTLVTKVEEELWIAEGDKLPGRINAYQKQYGENIEILTLTNQKKIKCHISDLKWCQQ
jgi:hypothetical protein